MRVQKSGDEGRHGRDAHGLPVFGARRLNIRFKVCRQRFDPFGTSGHSATGFGHDDPGFGDGEQLDAERIFKRMDAPTDGALMYVQRARRRVHRRVACQGQREFQVIPRYSFQVHRCSFASSMHKCNA